jgi:hypothetical protein
VTLVASVLATALLPAWYWTIPDGVEWGLASVDTLWEAGLFALLALPAAVVAAGLLRGMAWAESSLARAWLEPR